MFYHHEPRARIKRKDLHTFNPFLPQRTCPWVVLESQPWPNSSSNLHSLLYLFPSAIKIWETSDNRTLFCRHSGGWRSRNQGIHGAVLLRIWQRSHFLPPSCSRGLRAGSYSLAFDSTVSRRPAWAVLTKPLTYKDIKRVGLGPMPLQMTSLPNHISNGLFPNQVI